MRAIGKASQCRCINIVPGGAQPVGDPPPAPATMPRPMNQYESRHTQAVPELSPVKPTQFPWSYKTAGW